MMLKGILLSSLALMGYAKRVYEPLRLEAFASDNVTSKIDHFTESDTRTFQQRYFTNADNWDNKTQTGPIFLYICGEGECSPPSEHAYSYYVCQELGCLFYALEHRFYGVSQPFTDWTTDSLKYLNATQALADLNDFITNRNTYLDTTFGKATRKWVTIGGSYPGALSAWFKAAYPDSAVAAWSSSGVIHAIRDFTDFDLDIFNATLKSGDACPSAIKNITDYIEQVITQTEGKTADDLTYLQGVFGNKDMDNGDFMFYIADTFTLGVQYGGRSELCDLFTSVANQDLKLQLPVVKQYADKNRVTLNQYDRVSLSNTTLGQPSDNMRQWTWQYCTEFGWFQVPNADHPLRSQLINSSYWLPYCQAVFGADKVGEPAVDYYNTKYGGLNIDAKNIIFLNAGEDPWQWAGMRTVTNTTTQPDLVAYVIDCNNCGHCIDLKAPKDTDTPILTRTRNKIKSQLQTWLSATAPVTQKEEYFYFLQ